MRNAALVVALACGLASAQERPAVRIEGDRLINGLAFETLIFAAQRGPRGELLDHRIVRLGPGEAAALGAGGFKVERLELLDVTVPRASRSERCLDESTVPEAAPTEVNVDKASEALSVEQGAELKRVAQLERELTRLEVERVLDERQTQLDDPVRRQYELETTPFLSPGDQQERARNRMGEAVGSLAGVAIGAALIFGAGDNTKRMALENEAEQPKPIAEEAEKAAAQSANELEQLAREALATCAFLAQASEILQRLAPVSDEPAAAAGTARRVCSKPARLVDLVSLTLPGARGVIVLVDARFDGGAPQRLVARRLSGTSRFLLTLAWPLEASKCSLATGGGPAMALDAGRPPSGQLLRRAGEVASRLRRRLNELRFRAEGADVLTTILIP